MDISVVTDEKWLQFVIEQILSNALKYTKSGSISIYTVRPQTLVIEDTGIGIEPEDIARLGEKGFTGYNGRLDKKSTGLGPLSVQGDPRPSVPMPYGSNPFPAKAPGSI